MAVTRINNNQISDASAGNVYVGINAASKIQSYSITGTKLANNLTYGSDLTVSGNLTVQGNTTAIDTTYTTIEDPIILLASNQTGSPALDIGFVGQRGTSQNIAFVWDEAAKEFVTVYTTTGESNTTVSIASYADLHTGNANIGGNIVINGTTSFAGNIVGNVSLAGNVTLGNVLTSGQVSAAGNVTGGNLLTSGQVSSTGNISSSANISGGNITSAGLLNGTSVTGVTFSASGNLTSANVLTGGQVSATGNIISAANVSGGNLNATTNVNAVGVVATGNVSGGNLLTSGQVSSTGNITSAANVAGGNVLATTSVSAASLLGSTVSVSGNVTGSGAAIGGNVSGGNVLTTGVVSASGDVTSASNVNGGNINATTTVSAASFLGSVVSASSNITGGNVLTSGQVSATGNITSAANISGGNISTAGTFSAASLSASGNITGGNLISNGITTSTGNIVTSANVSGGNVLTSGIVSSTGNITSAANVNGGNLNSSGQVVASGDISGNNLYAVGVVSAAGNVTGGNVLTTGLISSTGNITSAANVAGGNVLATNIVSAATVLGSVVSASGNVTGGNILTGGYVSSTGNITSSANVNAANVNSTNLVQSKDVSATGNVYVDGFVSVTGNLYVAYVVSQGNLTVEDPLLYLTANTPYPYNYDIGFYSQFQTSPGDPTQANGYQHTGFVRDQSDNTWKLFSNVLPEPSGTINFTNAIYDAMVTGPISATGNITSTANIAGGNIIATTIVSGASLLGTIVSASSNITGGNILTSGIVSSTGNITSAANINGGNLNATGLSLSGNVVSNLNVSGNLVAPNVSVTSLGNGQIAIGYTNGLLVGGPDLRWDFANASLWTTNLDSNGAIRTTGTVSATGNVTGGNILTGGLISATGSITSAANVNGANVNATTIVSAPSVLGTIVSASSNITGGNVLTSGQVSASGNITASYYFGNGSQLTGVSANTSGFPVSAGTSNINAVTNSNISVSVGGTPNVVVWTSNGEYVTGLISATGNISSSANISTYANIYANSVNADYGNIAGSWSVGNTVFAFRADITQNVIAGNLLTPGIVSAVGNITSDANVNAGNVNVTSNVSTTGVSASGNITGGNILTGGIISSTGSITSAANVNGGNLNATTSVTSTSFIGTTASLSGNITGANLNTGGANGLTLNASTINSNASRIVVNSNSSAIDFAVNGTAANVFYINGTTNTASFGSSTQTTNAVVAFNATNSILFPVGNTAQRPGTGVTGMIRFNSTLNAVEVYDNSAWSTVGTPQFTVISDYQFSGDGSNVNFTMSGNATTTNSTIVSINGVVQVPTVAYSITGAGSNVVTFTEAPQTGDLIDVRVLTTTTQVTSISNSPGNAVVATNPTINEVSITGNLVPVSNATQTLGTPTNTWKSLYVAGNTIYLGGLQLQASGNTFIVYTADGTTQANIDVGNIDVSSITSGTTTIGISQPNGNTYMTVGGTSNVAVWSTTGQYVTGLISASGNITSAGNINANYLLGNAYYVTGLSPTKIYNGTTEVSIGASGGNANISVGGTSNVAVFSTTGAYISGVVSASGNVNGSNLNATNNMSASGNLFVNGFASITGNLYVANVVSTANLVVTDPLVYFVNESSYPYNYDIGFYSAFTGGTGNTYQHTGLVRDDADSKWKLFSNVPEPSGSTVNFTDAIYDTLVAGTYSATGNVSAAGNVSGSYLLGNAFFVTGLSPTQIYNGNSNVTIASSAGNVAINVNGSGIVSFTTAGIINNMGNGVGNIGNSSSYFNTVFAKATSAQYADLAENYVADAEYEPGTVLSFGGDKEVTISTTSPDARIAGVVSTNPSYIMNSTLEGEHVVTIALTGRVPTLVSGPVAKGDMMVSGGNGRAVACATPSFGTVIGKALENHADGDGIIEVVVGRL